MIIDMVTPWLYRSNQAAYEDLLAEAMNYSYQPGDTVDALSAAICKGTAMAVRVEYEDKLLAVAVLEGVEAKEGRFINIWAVAGVRIREWIDDLLAFVEEVAQRYECLGVMMGGRAGFQKMLSQRGFKVQSVIMRKFL